MSLPRRGALLDSHDDLPESVRVDADDAGVFLTFSSAEKGWDARLSPVVALVSAWIVALLLWWGSGLGLVGNPLELFVVIGPAIIPMYWVLKVLAVAIADVRHTTTRLDLGEDHIRSPLFTVPLSSLIAFSVATEGRRSALVAHTRRGPVRLLRHGDVDAIEAARAVLSDWATRHPVPPDDADFTVRMPENVHHETALGTQSLILTSAPGNLRPRRGLIVLALVTAVLLAGSFPVGANAVIFSVLGVLLLWSYVREILAKTTGVVLGQGSVSTDRDTVPLAAIQSAGVVEWGPWYRLVVETASERIVLLQHAEEAPLAAILAPIEQRVYAHRAALQEAGEDPDAVNIPAALEAMRQAER